MRRVFLLVALAGLLTGVGASVARADQPPIVLAGQPFYFSGTCSGIGAVILYNQSLAPRPALVVVEGQGRVVRPSYDTHARTHALTVRASSPEAGFRSTRLRRSMSPLSSTR